MKNLIYLVLGIAAAAFCVLAATPRQRSPRSIDDLAHNLQDAWGDNHTIA
jgi:hypothetical protein